MGNLWAFLWQTLVCSLAAGLILLVKWLLRDKLSPRWQYGVWILLIPRLLLPAHPADLLPLPFPLWLETVKTQVERTLSSAYSTPYQPISLSGPLPVFQGPPESVTDWLFLLYAAGAAACLVWYLLCYLRLRLLLRRGTPADDRLRGQVEAVCRAYGLKSCPVVTLEGLPSPFVCGVCRPVLAVPRDRPVDNKVLLHELLHLRYQDAAQNLGWCLLRALHWCNPFLQIVFRRIGNDLEPLCDQRVLEHLSGEDRQAYGGLLLDMASQQYPSAPGTTSISNGARHIARRITAIARFKRYPKGMALVSVCIAILLAVPILVGFSPAQAQSAAYNYTPHTEVELDYVMALTRLQRCTTPAGALDAYAKGLMGRNGVLLALASPLERQEELTSQMIQNSQTSGGRAYYVSPGAELTGLATSGAYVIYNVTPQGEDCYDALLTLPMAAFSTTDWSAFPQNDQGTVAGGGGGSVVLSVGVSLQDGWVVEERAPRQFFPGYAPYQLAEVLPIVAQYQGGGQRGEVVIQVRTIHTLAGSAAGTSLNWGNIDPADPSTPAPDALWGTQSAVVTVEYRFRGTQEEQKDLYYVGLELAPLDQPDQEPEFSGWRGGGSSGYVASSGQFGFNRRTPALWDGTLTDTNYVNLPGSALPAAYGVRIRWENEPVETLILEEVSP